MAAYTMSAIAKIDFLCKAWVYIFRLLILVAMAIVII